MSEPLVFMMGQFAAPVPTDRRYARNHMWALESAPGVWRCGFTAYAVRLLQDVYFLEWSVDAGATLRERQAIGTIESSKAESELYSPAAGQLVEFNTELLTDPSGINIDKYGAGWLFDLACPGDVFLTAADYVTHLAAAWRVAERTIKGQINED